MSALKKGTLVTWKEDKGFGFIQSQDSTVAHVFIHISGFRAGLERHPQVGDLIYYQVGPDETNGKLRAYNAHIKGVKDGMLAAARAGGARRRERGSWWDLVAQSSILCPLVCSLYVWWAARNPLPLIVYGVMSIITLILYQADKQRAQHGQWRVAENMLHLAELLGGWPGALMAQYNLRHKNAKFSYQLIFWLIVVSHEIGWLYYLWMAN